MVFIVFLRTDHRKIGEDNLLRLHKRFLHNFMEKINRISETEIKLEIELVHITQCERLSKNLKEKLSRLIKICTDTRRLYATNFISE